MIHKPGPLTDDEFAVMRSRAQIGHDIAATVPFLRPAAELILATHERFDGTELARVGSPGKPSRSARASSRWSTCSTRSRRRVYRDPISASRPRTPSSCAAPVPVSTREVVAAWLRTVDDCLDAPPGVPDAVRIIH